MDIRAKVFQDTLTETEEIQMDCMAYGMGMCCLQVTFQACDLAESRHLCVHHRDAATTNS